MIMYYWVFSSLYCLLFVSSYLFLFYHLSMQNLRGSLNINGGKDKEKRTLISEVSTQKQLTHKPSRWGRLWFMMGGLMFSQPWHQLQRRGSCPVQTAKATVLSYTKVVKSHVLIVRAEIESAVFCFVNVYVPNKNSERAYFLTSFFFFFTF